MKVLIKYTKRQGKALRQYRNRLKVWKAGYASIEIEEKELESLKLYTEKIEFDFELEIVKIPDELTDFVKNIKDEKTLIASLGNKFKSNWQGAYSMDEMIYYKHRESVETLPWIHCYTQKTVIQASDYIKSIKFLKQKAEQEGKKLLIYAALQPRLPYYSTQSLAYEVIMEILDLEDVIIKQVPRFKSGFCNEHKSNIIYVNELNIAQLKQSRRQPMLYNELFYEMIPPEQKIYIPLKWVDEVNKSYYEALGVNVIDIGGKILFLYDEKQIIERHYDALIDKVTPNFFNPILSKVVPRITKASTLNAWSMPQTSDFKGEGVYIGYITMQPIDYSHVHLRFDDGKSKIAWIWQQKEGDEGTTYDKEQIDAALSSNEPLKGIDTLQASKMDTYLLSLMSDSSKLGIQPAAGAQFIIGQINTAPYNLQSIYAGAPYPEAVQMADLIVVVNKMIEKSRRDDKALVLCLPYNTNIDCYDGAVYYNRLLSALALEEGCCFIVPTGEEADKRHHQSMKIASDKSNEMQIVINRASENLVGMIGIKGVRRIEAKLYPPDQSNALINLRNSGVSVYNGATVYSNGLQVNYMSGDNYILFRMTNIAAGTWKIRFEPTINPEEDIDLWLGEEAFNPSAELVDYTPFTTLGSNAATPGLFSVGGFDIKNLIVPRSSGRGFNWNDVILPICVLPSIIQIEDGLIYNMEGTIVAAAVLTTQIAILYSKWFQEIGENKPNTIIFIGLIKGFLYQFPTGTYPNRSEGYGLFTKEQFNQLIATPFYGEVT